MEHVSNEYTLTETSATSWLLSPLQVQRFKHTNKILQPGEPVVSKWEFENKNDRQPVQFILKANDRISDISLEIANYSTVRLDCVLEEGQYLKYAGGDSFLIYDRNWNEIKRFSVKTDQMNIPKGKVSFVFSCSFAHPDNMDKYASVEFKTVGEEIRLSAVREKNN